MLELYQGNDIKLHSPDVEHEYLFVRDLAQIISKLKGLTTCWNQIYNVSGKQEPLSSLIYSIEDQLKTSANCRGQIIKTAKRSNPCFFLDSSKLWNAIVEDMLTPTKLIVKEMAYYINAKSILKA